MPDLFGVEHEEEYRPKAKSSLKFPFHNRLAWLGRRYPGGGLTKHGDIPAPVFNKEEDDAQE